MISAQLTRLGKDEKVGVSLLIVNGAKFKLTQISTDKSLEEASDYSGVLLYYEGIYKNQFGLGFSYAQVHRSFDTKFEEEKVLINEEMSFFQVSGKAYFTKHPKTETVFYFGSDYNLTTAVTSFHQGGEELNDQVASTGFSTYSILWGFDSMLNSAALRFHLGYLIGKGTNNEAVENYTLTYNYNVFYIQLGTFYFF